MIFDLFSIRLYFFSDSYKCLFYMCFGIYSFNFLYLSSDVLDKGGEFVNF